MLAYISLNFPSLTTTFVHKEVLALRREGVPVQTYSVWPTSLSTSDPALRELAQGTVNLFPLSMKRFLTSHLALALSDPVKYIRTTVNIACQNKDSWRHRLNAWGSAYIARDMIRRGVKHIHAHFASSPASVAMAVSMQSDLSFSFTAHAVDIFAHKIMLKEKLKRSKFVIAISEHNKAYLIDLAADVPRVAEKIHVVHCGVDLTEFSPRDSFHRDEEDHPPLILSVAQMREKKGLSFLVEACRRLKSWQIDFQCVIIGGGEGLNNVQRLVRENGLENTVLLYGPRPHAEVRETLSRARIFVLPCVIAENGDRDGIPVSLMEAMAMGVPCVSTRVSGIPELITNGDEGFLVPPKDPEALAVALKQVLSDKDLRKRLATAARRKILNEFDLEKNTRKLMSIFHEHGAISGER